MCWIHLHCQAGSGLQSSSRDAVGSPSGQIRARQCGGSQLSLTPPPLTCKPAGDLVADPLSTHSTPEFLAFYGSPSAWIKQLHRPYVGNPSLHAHLSRLNPPTPTESPWRSTSVRRKMLQSVLTQDLGDWGSIPCFAVGFLLSLVQVIQGQILLQSLVSK